MPLVNPALIDMLGGPEWNPLRPSPDCQCSTARKLTMLPVCPEGAGGLPPPQVGGWDSMYTQKYIIFPLKYTTDSESLLLIELRSASPASQCLSVLNKMYVICASEDPVNRRCPHGSNRQEYL